MMFWHRLARSHAKEPLAPVYGASGAPFWHRLTTSRYTLALEEQMRELKEEIRELKRENAELARTLLKRSPEEDSKRENAARTAGQTSRLPRRVSFAQAKRRLEQDHLPTI
jgi:hypothetical protein